MDIYLYKATVYSNSRISSMDDIRMFYNILKWFSWDWVSDGARKYICTLEEWGWYIHTKYMTFVTAYTPIHASVPSQTWPYWSQLGREVEGHPQPSRWQREVANPSIFPWAVGATSRLICLNSTWIHIINIRRSHFRTIFIIGIPLTGKTVFILKRAT